MYNEIILSKLYTCIEHIEAIEKYFAHSDTPESFFELNNGANYDAPSCVYRHLEKTSNGFP